MLKIKDNIDLKELEKYYFKKYLLFEDYAYVKEYKLGSEYKEEIIVWIKDRTIQVRNSIVALNTLYDLIQDGLIEKVGINE